MIWRGASELLKSGLQRPEWIHRVDRHPFPMRFVKRFECVNPGALELSADQSFQQFGANVANTFGQNDPAVAMRCFVKLRIQIAFDQRRRRTRDVLPYPLPLNIYKLQSLLAAGQPVTFVEVTSNLSRADHQERAVC